MAKHPASNHIAQTLAAHLEQEFDFMDWNPVSGGDIHQAWSVATSHGKTFFIKTNKAAALPMFMAEAEGLKQLQANISDDNPLRVPHCYISGSDELYAWLVLEFIPMIHTTAESDGALGRGLALLHLQSRQDIRQKGLFGLESDTFIGSSVQSNKQEGSWLEFFSRHRLQQQLALARQNGFYYLLNHEAEQLLQALPLLLRDHRPAPTLLHGDLWSGNKGCDEQQQPVIFDPAIYYGDRECDLAMSELFSGFSPEFYEAYDAVYPIEQGYEQRKQLYNLYHILNHANLFGGHYIQQSKSIMQQLILQAG